MENNHLAEILLALMENCEYQQGLLEDLMSAEKMEESNEDKKN